jgi:hypothetical protein
VKDPAKVAVIALVTVAMLAAGCGGSGAVPFKKGGPPAPAECLKSWNADPNVTNIGLHLYKDHRSRAAQVYRITKKEAGLSKSCIAVFAVAESDPEFGIDGEVLLPGGWADLRYLPLTSAAERARIQRQAADHANARLSSDGLLAPLR